MKIMYIMLAIISLNVNAGMRCNGQLISEGQSTVQLINACGQPDQDGQNIIYINKDGDGMNYYIHAQSNGIIDSINFSRN